MRPRGAGDVVVAAAGRGIADLLDRWQNAGDEPALAALVTLVRGPLARVIAHTLRRQGIRDPGAVEDAWALVIEHLARLGRPAGPWRCRAFEAARGGAADPGWAYLACLARSRARDVARASRRRARIAAVAGERRTHLASAGVGEPVDAERFAAALLTLDARSRLVVELTLEDKTQAVIAHVLGVCPGTVSRILAGAIADLRARLAE